jgi:sugar transferase (PEP-CTERM/EpsH1 system associated)
LPLRILFITARLPWPLLRGDQLRAFHQIRALGRKHRVTLLCFSNGPPAASGVPALAECCERVVTVPLGPAAMARGLLRRLFSDVPLQAALYETAAMREALRRLAGAGCDLVHVQLARMGPFLDECGGPRVIDFVDALSLNMRRRARQDHPLARWLFRLEARRLQRYERRLCRIADRAVVASERDRGEIGAFPNLSVVTNAVEVSRFPFSREGREPHTLAFTGNMGYFPNADAVVWFARHVLPRIREALPAARFQVVGARPTREVRRLAAPGGPIEVVGYVEDIGAFLRRAAVSVAPIRVGAGQQFKVLEAMASGTPVVATSVAADGLDAAAGEHLLLADDAGAFAERTLDLLRDRALADRVAGSARRLVEARYTWERSVADLEEVYRLALEQRRRVSV